MAMVFGLESQQYEIALANIHDLWCIASGYAF